MSVSNKLGSKFLFYPRSYNKRGDVSMHSMIGMTESGQLINVKLRLPEKHKESKNAPSIVEFSRNDYRAKMHCIANDENGPENPEGILLLSGCRKEGIDQNKKLEVYIAKWADVICSDSESPRYHYGLSRMVIYPYSNEVIKLKSLLERAEKAGRDKEADLLRQKIDDPANWSYPVIIYYPEKMKKFRYGQSDELMQEGAELIDGISDTGITGGVALRAVNVEGHVVEESYCEAYSRYIVGENRNQTGFEVMDQLIQSWEWADQEKYDWEIFPIGKVNSGPVANKMYSKVENYDFVERYFYEDDKPRVCHGIIRVTHNEEAGITLLSKYFALSRPVGDPAKLDSNGGLSRIFEGEEIKLANLMDDDEITPRKDVIEPISKYQARAMWLFEDTISRNSFMNITESMDPVSRQLSGPETEPDPVVLKGEEENDDCDTVDSIDPESVVEEDIDKNYSNELSLEEIELDFPTDDEDEESNNNQDSEMSPNKSNEDTVTDKEQTDSPGTDDQDSNLEDDFGQESDDNISVTRITGRQELAEERNTEAKPLKSKKPAKPAHSKSTGIAGFLKKGGS